MPFTINKPPTPGETWTPTERLGLSKDGRAVPADSPESVELFCIPGREIPMELAIKHGAVVVSEVKEAKPAETKEVKPQETKAKKPARKAAKKK